jgi:hypothetical protein
MKRFLVVMRSVAGLVLVGSILKAGEPNDLKSPPKALSAPAQSGMILSTTSASAPAATDDCNCSQTRKICVSEVKHTTKKVYACKGEEYCLPRCSFLSLLWGKCSCDEGSCGDVKVRHRLIVKTVDGCESKQCVIREVLMDLTKKECHAGPDRQLAGPKKD